MAVQVGTAYLPIEGDLSGLSKQLAAALGGGKFGKLGKVAGVAFSGAMVAAGVGKALYDLGAEFDDAFDNIRVGTGKTGKQLAGLKNDLKAVVKTTPTDFGTASEAITGLNQRLGLTGKPLQGMSKRLLELSRITKTDLDQNLKTVTRTFGDWGVTVAKQPGALDAMFRASQATGATVGQLGEQMVKYGAPLRQMGFGFDHTAALLGKFEKEGVNAQLVMGSMRIALGKMAKAGVDDPAKALGKITSEIKNAGSAGEANALALEHFGARAGPDMAAAIREGRFELGDLFKTVSGGKDTVLRASKDTQDFSEKWLMFKNRVMVGLEPLATRVFTAVGSGMDLAARAAPGVLAAVANIRAAITAWVTASKADLTAIAGAFQTAFGFMATIAQRVWPGIKQQVQGSLQVIRGVVQVFGSLLRGDFSGVWDGLKTIVSGGLKAAMGMVRAMTAPFREVASRLGHAVSGGLASAGGAVASAAKTIGQQALAALRAVAGAHLAAGKFLITNFVRGIRATLGAARSAASAVGQAVVAAVRAVAGGLVAAGRFLITSLVRGIRTAIGMARSAVTAVGRGLVEPLHNLGRRFFELGKNLVQGLINGIRSMAEKAVGVVEDIGNGLKSAFETVTLQKSPSRVFHRLGAYVVEGLINGLKSNPKGVAIAMDKGMVFPLEGKIRELEAIRDRLSAKVEAATPRGSGSSSSSRGGSSAGGGDGSVSWARSMLGHFAESTGKNSGPELDRLQREWGTKAAAWCAMFVSKALEKGGISGLTTKGNPSWNVNTLAKWGAAGTNGFEKGTRGLKDSRAGDVWISSSKGHTGLIERIDTKRGGVWIIDGNSGKGKVARQFKGWGSGSAVRPDYPGGVTARTAATGATTGGRITESSWAKSLLGGLGIKASSANLKAIVGWIKAEGGHWNNKAKFNPLNTTQGAAGAKSTNSHGVKAYTSWEQGLAATIKTLKNGKYGKILAALRSGDPMAVANAIGGTPWGTHGDLVRSTIAATKVKLEGALVGATKNAGAGLKGSTELVAKLKSQLANVNVKLKGLEQLKTWRDALAGISGDLKGKMTEAMTVFHEKWEATVGKDLDDAAKAAMDAFDVETARQIEEGPAAKALKKLQAEADAIAVEAEDAANQKALSDAFAEGDQAAIAAAQARIAETARQRAIAQAQRDAEAEKERIEAERAARRVEVEKNLQAGREATYKVDSEKFAAKLEADLQAEYAQLVSRKQTYARFAQDVNRVLAKVGLASPIDLSAEIEGALSAGPGPMAPKKPARKEVDFGGAATAHGMSTAAQNAGRGLRSLLNIENLHVAPGFSEERLARQLGWEMELAIR